MKTNTMRTLLLVMLLFGAQCIRSQDEQKCRNLSGGIGHLNFSGEQINIGNLNSVLSANNYNTIHPITSSFGGGGLFSLRNFLFGGGGAWLMNSKTANPVNDVKLKGGYGYFNFGYLVYSGKRSLFYPTLGIGGGGYTILVKQKNTSANDFEQQLNNPG